MAISKRGALYPINRKKYLDLRKRGWQPLKDSTAEPWEKRLVARTIRGILSTNIGLEREIKETGKSMRLIIPIAANELASSLSGEISERDASIFLQLAKKFAENPERYGGITGPLPKEIIELGGGLSPEALRKITIGLARANFETFDIVFDKKLKKPTNIPDFEKDLEFQAKHDIFHSLSALKQFLESATRTGR
jgi:hypothetical protein